MTNMEMGIVIPHMANGRISYITQMVYVLSNGVKTNHTTNIVLLKMMN